MDTVLFDFDGVILDSFADQYAWFGKICTVLQKQFPYTNIEEFRKDYREPVYPDMYSFLGFVWDKEKDTIWKEYNEHKKNAKINLVNGIEETLSTLAREGYRMAIASSNTREAILTQLQTHHLQNYFSGIIAKENLPIVNGQPKLKPDPACLLLALDALQCNASRTVYVGDQPSDIHAVRNLAQYRITMPVIAVAGGYATREKLIEAKPDYLAANVTEIPRAVKELANRQ